MLAVLGNTVGLGAHRGTSRQSNSAACVQLLCSPSTNMNLFLICNRTTPRGVWAGKAEESSGGKSEGSHEKAITNFIWLCVEHSTGWRVCMRACVRACARAYSYYVHTARCDLKAKMKELLACLRHRREERQRDV